MPDRPKSDAFERAAGYLSLQMRTEREIRRYLKQKGYEPEEIEDAVKKLLEYQYLDDSAYVRSYICQAASRGKGRKKIEQELQARGVCSKVIADGWKTLEQEKETGSAGNVLLDEKKRALQTAVKMARQQLDSGKTLDEKFLSRVGRRLSGLGYSADVIYFVIGKLRGIRRSDE